MSKPESTRRILVIDDSESIHKDFRRILAPARLKRADDLALMEETLLGPPSSSLASGDTVMFEVDSAFQGQEGVAKVEQALAMGRPYALAFVDYRMPPGWNGLQTLRELRKVAPSLRVVLCSAYSDYSWKEVLQEFQEAPQLTELRKPFSSQELRRVVQTLTEP